MYVYMYMCVCALMRCMLTYKFDFSTAMTEDVDGVVNRALCVGKECAQRCDSAEVQLVECSQRLDEVHLASLQVSLVPCMR